MGSPGDAIRHLENEPPQSVEAVTNSYVALATGMNKWENNQFVLCNSAIELQANGATATGTRHSIIFSPTADDPDGTIDLLAPDGKRFVSQPIAISYYDTVS